MQKHPAKIALPIVIAFFTYLYWPSPKVSNNRFAPKLSPQQVVEQALSHQVINPPPKDATESIRALGGLIFFDKRFSGNGQVSCATCHQPERAFTDGIPQAVGIGLGKRNTPSLVNIAWGQWFFWDGRAHSLATQAMGPVENPIEHGFSRGQVASVLYRHYRAPYEKAFGPFPKVLLEHLGKEDFVAAPQALPIPSLDLKLASYGVATIGSFQQQTALIQDAANQKTSPNHWFAQQSVKPELLPDSWAKGYEELDPEAQKALDQVFLNFGKSLAAFESTITSVDSPFDKFLTRLAATGDVGGSLGEGFNLEAWEGFQVFARSSCGNCHLGPNFSDQQFHNIGLTSSKALDLGRSIGLLKVKSSQPPCETIEPADREACLELPYLNASNRELLGAFKTPTLRNLGQTAPYMHDGRFQSIKEVLDHYSDDNSDPAIGHRSESIPPQTWTDDERKRLIHFLETLNGPVSFDAD